MTARRLRAHGLVWGSLTGMLMIGLGDQRMARAFFRTARMAADETGDRSLRAWVAVREALIPLYCGDPREAISPARPGADETVAARQGHVPAVREYREALLSA